MQVWLDAAQVILLSLALLCYAGWGLALLLAPEQLRDRSYLLAPFLGLFLLDSLSHSASFAGLPGKYAVWVVLAAATVLNLAALRWRGTLWRRPNRFELVSVLAALPALLLAVAPILFAGQLLPIGDTNADPISYASTTEFLQTHGLRTGILITADYPVRVPIDGIISYTYERLGFEFFQIAVDTLAGRPAYATISIISAVGVFLWALAAGLLAAVLGARRPAALVATLLLASGALPLWVAFGGYGPQVLGMGLLVMAFAAWSAALQNGGWRWVGLAAAFSAGLAGIYSDALAYLLAPVAGLALCEALRARGPAGLWQAARTGGAGMALALAANPAGWSRAIPRAIRIMAHPNAGNVDWMIDLRQVLGLVPFGKDPSLWYGGALTGLLWLPALAMIAAAIFGFTRLSRPGRRAAAAFIVLHAASLAWFGLRHDPYGYFKAWTIGWFIYAILIGAGLWALVAGRSAPAGHRRALAPRRWASAVAGALVLCLALSGAGLSYSMRKHFACTPAIAQLDEWTRQIRPQEAVYVSTGDLSPVSVFWIAHFLRDHPARFDVPVIYTSFQARPYQDEQWVLRQSHAAMAWTPTERRATTVAQNMELELVSLQTLR